jgi:hypothetical protein
MRRDAVLLCSKVLMSGDALWGTKKIQTKKESIRWRKRNERKKRIIRREGNTSHELNDEEEAKQHPSATQAVPVQPRILQFKSPIGRHRS